MSTIPAGGENSAAWQAPARGRALSKFVVAALTRDYLPQLDPFINWLRQPLGWFALAAVASSVLGIAISPVGWSITAGLLSVIAAGLAFPWFAVRWTECKLQPQACELDEGQAGQLLLTVRNPLPLPLFGLTVEQFLVQPNLDEDAASDDQPLADIGLAQVDWLSEASFQLPICPEHRGRYPLTTPMLACSFPFGIWTARRPIKMVEQVSVYPRRVPLSGMFECIGRSSGDTGLGNRAGGHGDLLGVRDYRRGDSMRTIHWAQTAKLNSIVVCERGAPEKTTWQIHIDCRRSSGPRSANRENLAWRVRIAASLASLLAQQSIPFQLLIPGEQNWTGGKDDARSLTTSRGSGSLRATLERLTDIPLDGLDDLASSVSVDSKLNSKMDSKFTSMLDSPAQPHAACSVRVQIAPYSDSTLDLHATQTHRVRSARYVQVSLQQASTSLRGVTGCHELVVDLEADVSDQLCNWLRQVEQGRQAA